MSGTYIPRPDWTEEPDREAWTENQLESLAEAIQYAKLKTTREQMARLLREMVKGRDWRHGAWK